MDKSLLIEIFVPTTEGSDVGVKATGYPVGPRRVLTARHALFPDNRDETKPIEVRWYHQTGKAADWREITKIAWDGGASFDVALIDCEFPEDLPDYGMLSNEKPADHTLWASEGFARAGRKEGSRNPVPMMGEVHSAADTAREFYLGIDYRVSLDQGWKGASGSPVFVDDEIIGVVTSCPENFDQARLSATATWQLLQNPGFRREIGYDKRISSEAARQWVQFCKICKDITDHRMTADTYDKELYLQRNTVRQHVEAFLADPKKRGFILVGKSGVGKSNFLLALAEELHARSNVCVLMYHAQKLSITSETLTDTITQDYRDFRSQVVLSRQPVQQVWEEVARIDGLGERLVVFCVDAVNENTRAPDLLRQLDNLVHSPWPWLKIIFSSRPETWRGIKLGIPLSEALYYRAPDSERLGIELEQFSYSERMGPFSSHDEVGMDGSHLLAELPEVYSKYQHKYDLQTHYDGLSHELRETLRDPFHLLLVARTYKTKAIPAIVKPSLIINKYVTEMDTRSGEMRRFLENQVIPLMVRDGHYSRVITDAELDAAGDAIYEMIYDVQKNQAFRALCDADILVLEEQVTEDGLKQRRIRFKYERFYEYFIGERLADLRKTQADRYAFFLELIEETTRKPFFWGAVRNALAKEATKPNPENILKLCRTTEQSVKEMMVNVLIALGLDSPEQVEGILRNLIPQERHASEWQKIRYLVSKPAEEADPQTRSARKIAIEVASTLKLGPILQTAALHTDPTMRAMAVRYSYYLWQHDRAAGFAVIQYLAEKATTGVIPNCLGLESIFGLSLIIVCNDYKEKGALSRLQRIWHGMIAKLFGVREGRSPWKRIVHDFINDRVISFIITHVFNLLRELPANASMMNKNDLEAFFQLKPEDKQLYRRLVSYFDINGDYSREQMEQDYLAALNIDNVLLRFTTTMGLVAHACAAPHAFLPFLKQVFEVAKSDIATYPYLTVIFNVPVNALVRDKMNDEMFDFLVYTAEVCHECYTRHPEKYHNRYAAAPQTPGVADYILFQYRRAGTVRTTWVHTRIQAALKKPDLKFFELLLTSEFPQLALDFREPGAALAGLKLFFKSVLATRRDASADTPAAHTPQLEAHGLAKIPDMIQVFLSRLRLYYPEQVEDFLEEQEAPDEFRLQVRTYEPSEKVGDLIGMKAWYFVRDSALLGPAEGCAQLIGFFGKAAECKDARAWVKYVIHHLANLIYGGEALRESA